MTNPKSLVVNVSIRSQLVWVLVIVFALGVPMIWFHRASNRNLISFHGSLHSAISQRFVHREFPPENPFFAGEPVLYYWPFHYLGYLLSQATGQNVLYAFEKISLLGLIALAVAAVAVGRMIFRSASSGAIVALFVLAGSNPLGWSIALAKYLRHGPIVLGDVTQSATGPMWYLVQYGEHRLGPNFVWWMHTTSRAASLGLALVALVLVLLALRRHRFYVLVAVALSVACCIGINPLIGLANCGALMVGLVLTYIWQHLLPGQASKPILGGAFVGLVCSIMLGAVLAMPTFWHMVGAGVSSSVHIDPFRWKYFVSIGVNALPLLMFGLFGIVQVNQAIRPPLLIGLFGGLALLLLTWFFRMPAGNEHNFFNLACVFLALPATAFCIRDFHGELRLARKRVILTVMLFLPTPIVVMSAYAARPAFDIELEMDHISIKDAANPYGNAYNWIYENTESDAVIVMSPYVKRSRLCNTSDLPVMTARVLFVDHASYMTEMYPDFLYRCTLAKELTQGMHLAAADVEYMQQLGRPIYVLAEEQGEVSSGVRLRQRYGPPLFDGGVVQVYRWKSSS